MKTKKAVAKRITVRPNGEVLRTQGGRRHHAGPFTRKRMRRLMSKTEVDGQLAKNLKKMIHN